MTEPGATRVGTPQKHNQKDGLGPSFWLHPQFCQKTDSFFDFVVVVQPKIQYNNRVKSGSMLKI